MKIRLLLISAALGLCAIAAWQLGCPGSCSAPDNTAAVKPNELPGLPQGNPQARLEWETRMLANPATGEIPANMRQRELAFAKHLPQAATASRSNEYQWEARGPFNFGGRTRAAAADVTDDNILLAGSISGGIYRSTDAGQSWTRVSPNDANFGISALAQDTRTGNTNVWYSGAGENYNSASQGQSALYRGNGMMKSTDGGITWAPLASTASNTQDSSEPWDHIFRIATDPSQTDDVVFAAHAGAIERSTDGGASWTPVLGGTGLQDEQTDIAVSENGVAYGVIAAPRQSSTNDPDAGISRSTDGVTWTKIGPPASYIGNMERTVIAINPQNDNELYVLSRTPGKGKEGVVFNGDTETNSLWKYTYISGNGTGAGGEWENLSANIPVGPHRFDDFVAQGGYDLMIAVKPDAPNTVIIGGTNLYRSTDAFSTPDNTTYIGGYGETTDLPDFLLYENHHPDQHWCFFLPSNPDVMISCNDGGVFRTSDVNASPIVWESLNNEYNTTQFYTVYLDHGTPGSAELMGGLQDNGTFYTNSDNPNDDWTMPFSYDGAFGAIADGGSMYVTSIQVGRMVKFEMDGNGVRTGFRRIDPIGGGGYDFIHPFAMDPNDNNIIYLPSSSSLWRQNELGSIAVNNEWDSISQGWTQLSGAADNFITSISVAQTPAHTVFLGTSNGRVHRLDNANTGDPAFTNISTNMGGAGNVSCIAVDPRDGDKILVVISNYSALSLFYTEDGGANWGRVNGNLEGEAPDGAPDFLYYLGDGPSVRWAEIIPVAGGKTVYMIGTSVGLFATDELIQGQDKATDITEWVHQASETIGNQVVMSMDFRESDNYLAVGTHGAGIWGANINSVWGISGLEDIVANTGSQLRCYPNPASEAVNLEFELELAGQATVRLFDVAGRMVLNQRHGATAGANQLRMQLPELPAGIYTAVVECHGTRVGSQLVVR